LIWAQLGLCAGAIAVAGSLLSRYADVIADKTGWSGAWVGLVLLATVTSLPELATGISSVTLADAPDVAVDNVPGACVLNLSYAAVLDVLKRDEPLFQRARAECNMRIYCALIAHYEALIRARKVSVHE